MHEVVNSVFGPRRSKASASAAVTLVAGVFQSARRGTPPSPSWLHMMAAAPTCRGLPVPEPRQTPKRHGSMPAPAGLASPAWPSASRAASIAKRAGALSRCSSRASKRPSSASGGT